MSRRLLTIILLSYIISICYAQRKFLLVFFNLFQFFVGILEAVLLRDVTSITLRRGERTTGRRGSPVPQVFATILC